MRTKVRLFDRLDQLEGDLRALLVPALRRAALGRDDVLFITSGTNPYPQEGWITTHTSPAGSGILTLAHEILTLASQLGEPTNDLLASQVVRLFDRATDLSDSHRRAPARLARDFLAEIGEGIE